MIKTKAVPIKTQAEIQTRLDELMRQLDDQIRNSKCPQCGSNKPDLGAGFHRLVGEMNSLAWVLNMLNDEPPLCAHDQSANGQKSGN